MKDNQEDCRIDLAESSDGACDRSDDTGYDACLPDVSSQLKEAYRQHTYYQAGHDLIAQLLKSLCGLIQPDAYYSTDVIKELLEQAIEDEETEIINLIFSHCPGYDNNSLIDGIPSKLVLSHEYISLLSRWRVRELKRRNNQLVCQRLAGPCQQDCLLQPKRVRKRVRNNSDVGLSHESGFVKFEGGKFFPLEMLDEGRADDLFSKRVMSPGIPIASDASCSTKDKIPSVQSVDKTPPLGEHISERDMLSAITVEQLKALSRMLPSSCQMNEEQWKQSNERRNFVAKYFKSLTGKIPFNQQLSAIVELLFNRDVKYWYLGLNTGSGKTLILLVSVILCELMVGKEGDPSKIYCLIEHEGIYAEEVGKLRTEFMPGLRIDVVTTGDRSVLFGDANKPCPNIVITTHTMTIKPLRSPKDNKKNQVPAMKKNAVINFLKTNHIHIVDEDSKSFKGITASSMTERLVESGLRIRLGSMERIWKVLIGIAKSVLVLLAESNSVKDNEELKNNIETFCSENNNWRISFEGDLFNFNKLSFKEGFDNYKKTLKGICEKLFTILNQVLGGLAQEDEGDLQPVIHKLQMTVYMAFHLRAMHYHDKITSEQPSPAVIIFDDGLENRFSVPAQFRDLSTQYPRLMCFASATGENVIEKNLKKVYGANCCVKKITMLDEIERNDERLPLIFRAELSRDLLHAPYAALRAYFGNFPVHDGQSFYHNDPNKTLSDCFGRDTFIIFPRTVDELLGYQHQSEILLPQSWFHQVARDHVLSANPETIERQIALFQYDEILNKLMNYSKGKEVLCVLDKENFSTILLHNNRFLYLQNLFAGELRVVFSDGDNDSVPYKLDDTSINNIFSSSGSLLHKSHNSGNLVCRLMLVKCNENNRAPRLIFLEGRITSPDLNCQFSQKYNSLTFSGMPHCNSATCEVFFSTIDGRGLAEIRFNRPCVVLCNLNENQTETDSNRVVGNKVPFFLVYHMFLHHCLAQDITSRRLLVSGQPEFRKGVVCFAEINDAPRSGLDASIFSDMHGFDETASIRTLVNICSRAMYSGEESGSSTTGSCAKRLKTVPDKGIHGMLGMLGKINVCFIINTIISYLDNDNVFRLPDSKANGGPAAAPDTRRIVRNILKCAGVVDLGPKSTVATTQGLNMKFNTMFYNTAVGLPIKQNDLEQALGRIIRPGRQRRSDSRTCVIALYMDTLMLEIDNCDKFKLYDRYMPSLSGKSCAWIRLKNTIKIMSILYEKGCAGQINFSGWVTQINYNVDEVDNPYLCQTAKEFIDKITNSFAELNNVRKSLKKNNLFDSSWLREYLKLGDGDSLAREHLYKGVVKLTLHVAKLYEALSVASQQNTTGISASGGSSGASQPLLCDQLVADQPTAVGYGRT